MKQLVIWLAAVGLVSISLYGTTGSNKQYAIDERQRIFSSLEDELDAINRKSDLSTLTPTIANLAEDVGNLKNLFPQGSKDGSSSRRSVWTKNAKFVTKLDSLHTYVEGMHQSLSAGDEEQFWQHKKQAESTCKGCHMRFRSIF